MSIVCFGNEALFIKRYKIQVAVNIMLSFLVFDLPQNTSNFTTVDLAWRNPVGWLLPASTDSLCNSLHSVI